MSSLRYFLFVPILASAQDRTSEFLDAARKGDLAAVERLLEEGVDPNARVGSFEEPLLSLAARAGSVDVLKLLAAKGARLDAVNKGGYPALVTAALSPSPGAPEVIRTLLGLGADPNRAGSDNKAAPWYAAERGEIPKIEALLSGGVSVNWKNPNQETLVAIAATHGHGKAIAFLLERGADPNSRDDEGFTPLMNACLNPNVEVVRLLLAKGADRAVKSKYGDTALSFVHGKYDDTQSGRVRRAIADRLIAAR